MYALKICYDMLYIRLLRIGNLTSRLLRIGK